MIKFFRNIRQKLLSESKFYNYLIYAVGEIILVVIGILIALQINNWNEARKHRVSSREFHKRLADELSALSTRLDEDAERAAQLVDYIGKSVLILKKDQLSASGKDTLDFTLRNFFQFVRLGGELKTFQEMESTGQLGLIYNKELKDKTLEYLAMLEVVSKMYDQMAEQVNNTEFIDKYVTLYLEPQSTKSTLDYDFEDLAGDKFLINRLARFGYYWQSKQYFSDVLSKSTSNLRDLYLQEINTE